MKTMHHAAIEYCALSGLNSKHSLCIYLARGEIRTGASEEGADECTEFCDGLAISSGHVARGSRKTRAPATLTKNGGQETLGGRIVELQA
jgi:hypothetical protein